MKKLAAILFLSLALTLGAGAQETAKTGWNFGPLPAIGYSSDLGLHFGALTDIYQYGDGSKYPDYLYKINVEASAYLKGGHIGNVTLHSFFDSKHLIPGMRVSGDISYFGNKLSSFYGFNGASAFNKEYEGIKDGGAWYLMRRDIFRVMGCLQGKFGDSNWGWAGGLSYYNFTIGEAENTDIDKAEPSLFKEYVAGNVIPEDEAKGGNHLELKAGVVFDTRDHENNPQRGTNLEVFLVGSPDVFGQKRNNYLNLSVHFKQFYPLFKGKAVFGYHLGLQTALLGDMPFYMLQTISVINLKQINPEGLGSTCSFRGTAANRMVAKGYGWLNTEIRVPFVKFDWIKQHWQLVVNPFIDGGMITQPYRLKEQKDLAAILDPGLSTAKLSIYDDDMEKCFHISGGVGLHVIMNQNFNINFEVAKVIFNSIACQTIADNKFFPKNDGTIGINVGLNYIF